MKIIKPLIIIGMIVFAVVAACEKLQAQADLEAFSGVIVE
jgi:hypothetical protein